MSAPPEEIAPAQIRLSPVQWPPSEVWASNSSLTMHRNCPQQWFYAHVRRLEKIEEDDPAVERDMGSWWHALMAADSIDRGRRLGSLQQVPTRIRVMDHGPFVDTDPALGPVRTRVVKAAVEWWLHQSPLVKGVWDERVGEDLPHRLAYLFNRWAERWKESRSYEHPLAVELRWTRELPVLPGPQGTVNPRLILVGYVDEVYLDTKRNLLVIRDHKIHKKLGTQTVADDMMDSQLQLYAWGASPQITAWGRGRVTATAYDRVRMVKPAVPQVTQMGSLSKSVTDYDLHTYVEWCNANPAYPGRAKDGSGAGIYRAEPTVLDRLGTPAAKSVWHQRTLTPLNANLIRAHLRAAVDSAVDQALSRARARQTGEAPRNLTPGCRWCDFVSLCRVEMVGGPGHDVELSDHGLRLRVPDPGDLHPEEDAADSGDQSDQSNQSNQEETD